jgi:hypothetical protein
MISAERRTHLVLGLACAAIVVIAFLLEPAPRGWGSHQRLYLPPCGFRLMTGLPCATCGLTTSYCNMARGRVGAAFRAHPAGIVLLPLTAAIAVLALLSAVTGRHLLRPFAWVLGPWGWKVVLVAIAAFWIWQLTHR